VYRDAHRLFLEALDAVAPDTVVPACPRWLVRHLLAHQVHQLIGACDGSFPVTDSIDAIAAADPAVRRAAAARQGRWIDEGVRRLQCSDVAALTTHWRSVIDDAPDVVLDALVPDLGVHLFDLLGAAADLSHRQHPIVMEALRFWADQADRRVRLLGTAGLRLEVRGSAPIGDPEAEVVVAGDAFELLRAIAGRRHRAEAAAILQQITEPAIADAIALYGWRDTPLDEG
jgi:hypothetical protein